MSSPRLCWVTGYFLRPFPYQSYSLCYRLPVLPPLRWDDWFYYCTPFYSSDVVFLPGLRPPRWDDWFYYFTPCYCNFGVFFELFGVFYYPVFIELRGQAFYWVLRAPYGQALFALIREPPSQALFSAFFGVFRVVIRANLYRNTFWVIHLPLVEFSLLFISLRAAPVEKLNLEVDDCIITIRAKAA